MVLSRVQSFARILIHNSMLFNDTWYNKSHWLTVLPYLGIIDSNVLLIFRFIIFYHISDNLKWYHTGELTNPSVMESSEHMIPNAENSLVFGKENINKNSSYCNHEKDEVQIFEVALNAEEVADLFESQSKRMKL